MDMGHEVNMITSWREQDSRKSWFESQEAGIRVHWLPVPYSNKMTYGERIRAFLRFAMRAAKRAASLPADVVFATSTPLTIALPGAYAARRQKAPMVFEVRDLWPDVPIALGALNNRLLQRLAFLLENFAYKRSSRIVALTPTMRDFISGKRVALEKMDVIPNGSNILPELSSESLDYDYDRVKFDRPALLYCGSLGPAHGPEYIVHLASALHKLQSPVQIVVVGDGRLKSQLVVQAKNAGCLDTNISFLGSVPRDRIHQYFIAADASIMTMAHTELLYRHSVQNKFFDSLAAGCPVFANYSGWASEVAQIEGVGETLPFDDIGAAAQKVHKRLSDDNWIKRSGRLARKLAEERFNLDLLAAKLETTLAEAVTSTASR